MPNPAIHTYKINGLTVCLWVWIVLILWPLIWRLMLIKMMGMGSNDNNVEGQEGAKSTLIDSIALGMTDQL